MFEPLFNEFGNYTPEAERLDREVTRTISDFFKRGYSPRDVMLIITLAATVEMSSEMCKQGLERYRNRTKLESSSDNGTAPEG